MPAKNRIRIGQPSRPKTGGEGRITMKKGDIITGKIIRSHYCGAGWRSHESSVKVEVIGPKMGVVVDSDGTWKFDLQLPVPEGTTFYWG